ncbi:permease prefix domain 1-containing protein [Hamadaea sp. NPDC050747]|uniref:permease prefix domain 1-containing protein n=1 Tax=Hamadaea sp. NPDC050747 TaxID=3155789 RepID=UPI003408F41A
MGHTARAGLLDEIADGLACAIETRTAGGGPVDEAAQAAVAEFGDPRQLAAGLLRQVAAMRARRIGAGLVITGPLVGAAWVTAYAAPGGIPASVSALVSAVPLLIVALGVAVPCALLAYAAGDRRFAALLGRAGAPAGLVATVACCCADLLLLTHATAVGQGGLVLVAACVSAVRLALTATLGLRLARVSGSAR